MQQRQTNQVRRVSRAKLPHGFGAVTFEGARADTHAQRALLVGIALADQVENLTLSLGERLLVGAGSEHHAGYAGSIPAHNGPPVPDGFSRLAAGLLVPVRQLLDHGANALGLLQRVL